MKKLSLVLAAVVLSASISFAQEKAAANKTSSTGKSSKSTGTSTKATKPAPAKDSKPAKAATDKK